MNRQAPAVSVLQLRSSAGLYGADRMVLSLNESLRQHGVRSRLLSINNYRLDQQPVHQHAISTGQDAVLLPCGGRLDMQTVAALVAQIDACQATALHVHDYKSAFYAWLATRRRPQVKLVATLHGWVEASRALRLYNTLEITLLRRFDVLAVVSQPQIERLSRAGIPLSRIHQIDNGIVINDTAAVAPDALRAELGLEDPCRIFAAVGRLSPEKNLSMLLDAFAFIAAGNASVRLLLVGDGPERDTLQAKVAQLGLHKQVIFTGNRPDMDQVYPLIDCLLLPSLSEGMPLVVLEAMSRAIPVIASAVGDIPRLLANSGEGKLVPAGDEAALRIAMLDTLAHPVCRDDKAAHYVRTHHSSQAMAGKYLQVYQALRIEGHDRKIA